MASLAATQLSSGSRCRAPAFAAAGARRPGRAAAVVRAAASGEAAPTLDRRQAMLGLAAAFVAANAAPSAQAEGDVEIFYGLATPPTSYGGYGGVSNSRKDDAKYIFEHPAGWKSETINKRDKGTQGVDCRIYNPKQKLQQVFVIVLGRAGEDNRSFRLTNVDSTLSGFAGADYDMLDALNDVVLRVDEQREVDGQLYYDVEFASPDVHYLSSITVNEGKVYAMFVKSPAKMFEADEAALRAIRASYRTGGASMGTQRPWYEAVELSPEQHTKVEALQASVADAVAEHAPHRAFCTHGTYIRYLRARSWNVAKAAKMLRETLRWRVEYGPQALDWERTKAEGARGKLHVLDHPDNDGRPVVLMRPRLEAVYSGDSDERVKWLVYTLEQAARLADASAPDGKMTWLIDFVGYNSKNSPPLKVSLQVLHILQNHYPERLGCAVCYKPPLLFNVVWKAVGPFVDPHTRDKLVFLSPKSPPEALAKHFDPQHIDDSLGGHIPIEQLFDYEGYGERMKAMDAQAAAVLAAAQAEADAAEAAAAEAAKARRPSDSAAELDAEFERHVVDI
ncbi:random slug 5-like [Micractinium conductrix]|uniref:Random slug 5-like n=1 Tax=Micractinium conductrix TaxID=554055 RepID=A0A2P6VLR4_9CHLO|nr:random slug 5-like [Micractinium conductrix]|eukprot:PSC75046.1 random slug 5-like [Micractinium conductrix]